MNKPILIGTIAAIAAIVGGGWWVTAEKESTALIADESTIVVPELSQIAQSGEIAFKVYCAVCHGVNASGTDQGPSLIHKFYEPSHHGDLAIQLAVQNGVRAHHWRFGDMPPVEEITETQIQWVTKYIREIQAANGIN